MKRILLLSLVLVIPMLGCGSDEVTGPGNKFFAEADFEYRVLAGGRDSLQVEGINGAVEITGVNGATTISITGTKRVEATSQLEADAGLGLLEVEIDSTTAEIGVRTDQPTDGRTYKVDYEITIPDDYVVTVFNDNGGVAVNALQNDLSVECENGAVVTNVLGGDVRVVVGNGGISGNLALAIGGIVNLQVGNGGIAIGIPQNTSAKFAATVGNGTITTSNLTLTDVTQTPTSLSGTLGGGNGSITLGVVNGTIAVAGY
jgi:hypothetical protein